jgi:transposase
MAMTIVEPATRRLTVGIDTHSDVHVAAALDEQGRLVGTESFPTTPTGDCRLHRWALELGTIDAVGIEGTGSWGAGIARHLTAAGCRVIEVDRADRALRRRKGKSDTIDAEAAARAVQAGTATGIPNSRTGIVESIRVLRVARRSAVKARTQGAIQLRDLVSTAPNELRADLRDLTMARLVERCAGFRPADRHDPTQATKTVMRSIARRWQHLNTEITELDADLDQLVADAAPNLLACFGVGTDVAGQLLVTAGDNPERLHSEAAFAQLCGVAPIPASSGRTNRHRLNRGGDRQANAALYRIVLCRLRWHAPTQAYMQRRTAQGLSKPEIIRCLKRAVARQIHHELLKTTA